MVNYSQVTQSKHDSSLSTKILTKTDHVEHGQTLHESLYMTSRVLTNLFKWPKNPDRLNQTMHSRVKITLHNNFILPHKSS